MFKDILDINLNYNTKTKEGYLFKDAGLTKVGVYDYRESSITGNHNDTDIVGVYRTHESVFHTDTFKSAKGKPITYSHPDEDVTSETIKKYSVGNILSVKANEDILVGETMIHDSDIVDYVLDPKNKDKKQTSLGYDVKTIREDGEYEGKRYKYKTTGFLDINHLSIVGDKGRCGSTIKINDSKEEVKMKPEEIINKVKEDSNIQESLKDFFLEKYQQTNLQDSKVDIEETEEFKTKLTDSLERKIELVQKAKQVLGDKESTNIIKMSNREILEKVSPNHTDKSDDYLSALLDSKFDLIEESQKESNKISENYKISKLADSKSDFLSVEEFSYRDSIK